MIELDGSENGGKLTSRDAWNISNHRALKLVVVEKRDASGEILSGRYIERAAIGAKYRCAEAEAEWFIEFGEHPCKYCEDKEGCRAETLEKIESDILIVDYKQELEHDDDRDDEYDEDDE